MRFPWPLGKRTVRYRSATEVESRVAPGVRYTIAKMSFARRVALMAQVRELAKRAEFLAAGQEPGDKMDAVLVGAEVERLYVSWGLKAVRGLVVDGEEASPELLATRGPEELFREALGLVRAETGLNEKERKN